MIVDQLFTPKLIKEGEVYDLGREYGAPAPAKKPKSQEHNPYPYSPEEDEDYFREIFRKKREAAKQQGMAEGNMDGKVADIKGQIAELEAEQEQNEFGSYAYDTVDGKLQYLYAKLDKAEKGVAEGLGYSQDPAQAKWYHEGRKAFKGGTTGNLIQDIAKKHGCPSQWIDAFHAGYEDQQGWGKDDVNEDQLDEVDWKAWQDKMKAAGQGAKEFTQNVRDTGDAAAGMINAYGGAGKELGKQLIARPTSAAYNATKSGLNKAADVAKGVYGDVKQGTQAVGQAVDTVGTDVGQGLQKVGRGVANVTGGTAGALGSVVGGATTGLGRAGVKGFNTGVQNVGGDAVDRAETNIFKPKSNPVEIKKQIDLKKKEIADLETQLKTAVPTTGGAQTYDYTGSVNPATDRPWTKDELLAMNQPTAPAALPRSTYAPGVGATPTNVTYGPGFGGNYYKQKVTPTKAKPDAFAQSGFQAPAMAEDRIAVALKKPLTEMLKMVETKEDVYRIKQFVDETFVKYGAVNESAFAVRNKIIEHVTQIGAQRRREHARKSR